jgi:ribonucleoside-diphosphate reductase alpha chain
VEFPCKAPDTAKVKKDSNVEEQLNWYLHVQKNWCEHNASATIYVKPDEWLKVGAFIYEHFDEITGVSFLPDDGGVYELAPLESITEEEYIRRAAAFPGIDYSRLPDFEKEDATEGAKTLACVGDRCVL